MSKAIVFDLDGTLVDSAPDLMDAHNYVMQKFGYHQKPLTDIRHLAGRGAANMILSSLKEEEKKFDQNIHKKMTAEKDGVKFFNPGSVGRPEISADYEKNKILSNNKVFLSLFIYFVSSMVNSGISKI